MKGFRLSIVAAVAFIIVTSSLFSQTSNLRQYYSAKLGYYSPGEGLNNGLLIGADGLTEFLHYPLLLTVDIDLYMKKSINLFDTPQPEISDQQIVLFPIHLNVGYRLLEIPDAGSRIYAGAGAGYYLSFYSLTYRSSGSSGGLHGGGLTGTPVSDSRSGGRFFGTLFLRLMVGSVFAEPRLYLAPAIDGSIGGYVYHVRPSGYSLLLGFQYH